MQTYHEHSYQVFNILHNFLLIKPNLIQMVHHKGESSFAPRVKACLFIKLVILVFLVERIIRKMHKWVLYVVRCGRLVLLRAKSGHALCAEVDYVRSKTCYKNVESQVKLIVFN